MPDIKKIPVFPLPIIVFPEEELRLHIFEPRYKELIKDCSEKGIVFGIIPVINSRMKDIGTIVKLEEIVKEYDDGRMDIKLSSHGLFRVMEFHSKWPGKMYSGADMEMLEYSTTKDTELESQVMQLFNELCEINHVKPFHPISWDQFVSFKLGHYVGFTLDEEYNFCILATEKERLNKLLIQLDHMIAQSKQRQEWLKRMNMNGEFRNFDLKNLK
jgi:Lon protease-like protein